jgi:hypothetical protein
VLCYSFTSGPRKLTPVGPTPFPGEIRARRMAQLQASGGGGGGGGGGARGGPPMGGPGGPGGGGPGGEGQSREEQEAKQRAEDEQMRTIMASVLEPEARERRTSDPPLFAAFPSASARARRLTVLVVAQ